MGSGIKNNWDPDDKLNRRESGVFLTNYLTSRYAAMRIKNQQDSFVLNIRAGWGYGKTFFLTRWMQDLRDSDYPVVYFDAWSNDFADDPLIGFIDAINEGLSDFFHKKGLASKTFDDAISLGKKLIKPVGVGVAAILVKQLSGIPLDKIKDSIGFDESAVDASDEVSSLISKCADIALEEHKGRRETIKAFKSRLSELINELNGASGIQLPVFIFIDELDRCRPTYAIELLEAIKHLFGVPGVYFVAATNIEQLGHSIKVVYGDGFDSDRYLKRFFDSEYSLPAPDKMGFSAVLFEKFGLINFRNYYSVMQANLYPDADRDIQVFTWICDGFDLSLRDREAVVAALFAVLASIPSGEEVHIFYLIFLIAIRHVSAEVYDELSNSRWASSVVVEKVKPLIVRDIIFRERDLGGGKDGEVNIFSVFKFYCTLSRLSVRQVSEQSQNRHEWPGRIVGALERSQKGAGSSERTKLESYESRVRHAGQLI